MVDIPSLIRPLTDTESMSCRRRLTTVISRWLHARSCYSEKLLSIFMDPLRKRLADCRALRFWSKSEEFRRPVKVAELLLVADYHPCRPAVGGKADVSLSPGTCLSGNANTKQNHPF